MSPIYISISLLLQRSVNVEQGNDTQLVTLYSNLNAGVIPNYLVLAVCSYGI